LRIESATPARLWVNKEESDAILGEEEAVDVSPGGHITQLGVAGFGIIGTRERLWFIEALRDGYALYL